MIDMMLLSKTSNSPSNLLRGPLVRSIQFLMEILDETNLFSFDIKRPRNVKVTASAAVGFLSINGLAPFSGQLGCFFFLGGGKLKEAGLVVQKGSPLHEDVAIFF